MNSFNDSTAGSSSPTIDAIGAAATFVLRGGTMGQLRGITPEQYEVLYTLAYDNHMAGQYRQAAQMFSLLFSLNPYDRRYAKGMASSLQREGHYEQALACWGAVVLLDLDDSVPVLHACECLIALGRLDEAMDSLEPVLAPGAQEPAKVRDRAGVLAERIRRQHGRGASQ